MRTYWTLGTMLLLLLTAMPTLAQSFYCSTLNRTDCALFDRRDVGLPESASFNMTSNTIIRAGFDSVEFSFDMNGSYRLDPEQTAAFEALLEANEDLEAINRETALQLLTTLLGAADADLFMTLTLPRDVMIVPLQVDLWFVDSVGYIDLTSIVAVAGQPTLGGIYGFDLANAALFGFGLVEDEDWDEVYSEFMAEIDTESSTDFTTPLKEQLSLNEAIEITRETDNEAGSAVFLTEIEVLPLLALESFRESFYSSQTTTELSRSEVDALLDALADTLETEGIRYIEIIEPDTGRTVGVTMNTVFAMETSEFADQYAQTTGDYFTFGEGIGTVNVDFEMTITRDNFDMVTEIVEPKDADIVSLFELIALLGQ